VQHRLLVRRHAVRLQAATEEIVRPHEQVLDVVGIRAGHDADVGVELRAHFQGLALRRLRGQPLLQELALGLGVAAFLAEEQSLGEVHLLAGGGAVTLLLAGPSSQEDEPDSARERGGQRQQAEAADASGVLLLDLLPLVVRVQLVADGDGGVRVDTVIHLLIHAGVRGEFRVPDDWRQRPVGEAVEANLQAINDGKERQLAGVHLRRRVAERFQVGADVFALDGDAELFLRQSESPVVVRSRLIAAAAQLGLRVDSEQIRVHHLRQRGPVATRLFEPLLKRGLVVAVVAAQPRPHRIRQCHRQQRQNQQRSGQQRSGQHPRIPPAVRPGFRPAVAHGFPPWYGGVSS
jgi:hypothetical protein